MSATLLDDDDSFEEFLAWKHVKSHGLYLAAPAAAAVPTALPVSTVMATSSTAALPPPKDKGKEEAKDFQTSTVPTEAAKPLTPAVTASAGPTAAAVSARQAAKPVTPAVTGPTAAAVSAPYGLCPFCAKAFDKLYARQCDGCGAEMTESKASKKKVAHRAKPKLFKRAATQAQGNATDPVGQASSVKP